VLQQAGERPRGGLAVWGGYFLILAAYLALAPFSLHLANELAVRSALVVVAFLAAIGLCLFRPGDRGLLAASHYGYQRRTLLIGGGALLAAALIAMALGLWFLMNLQWKHAGAPPPSNLPQQMLTLLGSLIAAGVLLVAMAFILIRTVYGLIRLAQQKPIAARPAGG
jgi:uncharacterized membrane protein